jgi:glycosyltransferase involved in cell wall biosynthesis
MGIMGSSEMIRTLSDGPPLIRAVEAIGQRPFWSVMIPTFNPRVDYLTQTLDSVLAQDPGHERMQIEVVDDCSTKVDVAPMVSSIAKDRVSFSRTPTNLGLAGCWNTCIQRSRGLWVHILHQDDYVGAGFYGRLQAIAESHTKVGLIASRSIIVDKDGAVGDASRRILSLENGGNAVEDFFYETPIPFAGVTVHRQCYEECGGFRPDLTFTLDCEMWARAIARVGGLVTSDVLAFYRYHHESETIHLWKTGEALADIARLNSLFSDRYANFDAKLARRRLLKEARAGEAWLRELGDEEGARTCRNFWKQAAKQGLKDSPRDARLWLYAYAPWLLLPLRTIDRLVRRVKG